MFVKNKRKGMVMLYGWYSGKMLIGFGGETLTGFGTLLEFHVPMLTPESCNPDGMQTISDI
jgi:hypothetical protein